jgi:hypothetical protein
VCVGLSVPISYPTNSEEAKVVVNQLIDQQGANVIVLVTLEPRPILLAAEELGVLDRFIWIGKDSREYTTETYVQLFCFKISDIILICLSSGGNVRAKYGNASLLLRIVDDDIEPTRGILRGANTLFAAMTTFLSYILVNLTVFQPSMC